VSDLSLLKPLPPAVERMVEALVGCVAGAVLMSETERMAKAAGLVDIVLKPTAAYVEGMVDWQDPLYRKIMAHLPAGAKPSDYITSLEVTGRKPPGVCGCNGSAAEPSHFTPEVAELVGIGAAIAANCEPCFKHHSLEARKLGVSLDDVARAVDMAQSVKQAPTHSIARLVDELLHGNFAAVPESDYCSGPNATTKPATECGR